MKGFLKKKPADLNTGESIGYTVLLLAAIYGPIMLFYLAVIWWSEIKAFFVNLKKRIFKE